jgi:AraC-like DNA-binding protein
VLSHTPLFVRHSDRALQSRLGRISAGRFDYQVLETWTTLRSAVRRSPVPPLVVVDPYALISTRPVLDEEVERFVTDYPSTVVLAALTSTPRRWDDVRLLGKWGVTEVMSISDEISDRIIVNHLRGGGQRLGSFLDTHFMEDGSERTLVVRRALHLSTAGGGGVPQLARRLQISTKTLQRLCFRARLPRPGNLLLWLRLLRAAELMEDPGRTLADVAHACGYASDSTLRQVLTRTLKKLPTDIRANAFETTSRAFLSDIARRLRHRAPGGTTGGGPCTGRRTSTRRGCLAD